MIIKKIIFFSTQSFWSPCGYLDVFWVHFTKGKETVGEVTPQPAAPNDPYQQRVFGGDFLKKARCSALVRVTQLDSYLSV